MRPSSAHNPMMSTPPRSPTFALLFSFVGWDVSLVKHARAKGLSSPGIEFCQNVFSHALVAVSTFRPALAGQLTPSHFCSPPSPAQRDPTGSRMSLALRGRARCDDDCSGGGGGGGDRCGGCSNSTMGGSCAFSSWHEQQSSDCSHCSRSCWIKCCLCSCCSPAPSPQAPSRPTNSASHLVLLGSCSCWGGVFFPVLFSRLSPSPPSLARPPKMANLFAVFLFPTCHQSAGFSVSFLTPLSLIHCRCCCGRKGCTSRCLGSTVSRAEKICWSSRFTRALSSVKV